MSNKVLPAYVKVGVHTYAVREKALDWADEKGAYGQFSHEHGELCICTEYTPAITLEVFLHEILHAIWFGAGISGEAEESVVNSLGLGLAGFFVNNPETLVAITKLKNQINKAAKAAKALTK